MGEQVDAEIYQDFLFGRQRSSSLRILFCKENIAPCKDVPWKVHTDKRYQEDIESKRKLTKLCYSETRKCVNTNRLSEEERRVDALAPRAEERRDKLRKAAGRSTYPLSRRFLNGETRLRNPQSPYAEYIGIRREPGELKHLSSRRKRKKYRFRK